MVLQLKYVLNTHVHADHVTGSGLIKQKLNSQTGGPEVVQSILCSSAGGRADLFISDGDEIKLGDSIALQVIATPGHTNGCVSYWEKVAGLLFTGDALLIRGCGRTDFQQGSAATLYDSVTQKLFTLPDDTKVYPAHDYLGRTVSSIGEEKKFNPRLTQSKDKFIEIMANLNLDYPKMIGKLIPLSFLHCFHSLSPYR